MKYIKEGYIGIAILGFILPISSTILMKTPTLFSAFFMYLLSFGFKPKTNISPLEIGLLIVAFVTLCMYSYQLIRLYIEPTSGAKKSYVLSTLMYSICGGVYLLMQQQSFVWSVCIVLYFILLVGSTGLIRQLSE